MNRLVSFLTGILFLSLSVNAQNVFRYGFGGEDFHYHNPAAEPGKVLFSDKDNSVALYSGYNFDKSPFYGSDPLDIQADYIRKWNGGTFGASYSYDGYSYYRSHNVSARFSKVFSLRNGALFSAGFGASLYAYDFFRYDSESVIPDFEFGMEYRQGRMKVGAALKNALSIWGYAQGMRMAKAPRSLWINFSYDCPLAGGFVITPYFSGGYLSGLMSNLGMKLSWRDKAYLSYTYFGANLYNIISGAVNIGDAVSLGLSVSSSNKHNNILASALLVVHF